MFANMIRPIINLSYKNINLRRKTSPKTSPGINLSYNNRNYEIEIIECRPANAICVIETDVNVDFAPPKDYVEPPKDFGGGAGSSSGGANGAPNEIPDYLKQDPQSPRSSVGGYSDVVSAGAASSIPSSRIFGGAGQRLDGKALKHVQ